jgi:hypothetical protein
MRVCRLSYPASKAHAPYYIVICDLFGSTLLFQTISKRHYFRKKCIKNKVSVLTFSTSLSETFLLLTIQRDTIKNVRRSSAHYSCKILIKLEFPPQIFGNNSNNKFQTKKSVHREASCSMRMDRYAKLTVAFRILRTRPKHIPAVQYKTIAISNLFAI